MTRELVEELRAEGLRFAQQVGVPSCSEDCSMCWIYRSDMPCRQRDIVNAMVVGANFVLTRMGKSEDSAPK